MHLLFCKRERLAFTCSRAARCCGCTTNHPLIRRHLEAYQNANRPHCTLIYASYASISPNNERQMCMAFILYLPQIPFAGSRQIDDAILPYALSNSHRMLAFVPIFGIIYGRTRCKLYLSRLRHVPKQSIPATIARIVGNVRIKKDGVDMVGRNHGAEWYM